MWPSDRRKRREEEEEEEGREGEEGCNEVLLLLPLLGTTLRYLSIFFFFYCPFIEHIQLLCRLTLIK